MHRRTPAASAARHSPFTLSSPPPVPALGYLLHTFELATVVEAHAVTRVALARNRDLQATHAALARLGQAIDGRGRTRWAKLEIQFHRTLNDQGGNLVLASLAERTLRDGLTACPIPSAEVLTILQSHHHEILRCVEGNEAETAARWTRAHVLYLRDVLVGAARDAARTRVRLPT